MRKRWKHWDEKLFSTMVKPATKEYLRSRLNRGEDEELEVGVEYPIVRSLLGVSMEEGTLRLVHVSMKLVLEFLNDLVGVFCEGKEWKCMGTSDVSVVKHWVKRLGLDPIDEKAVEGYAVNYELVEWISEPFSGIQLKYRTEGTRLLVIYRFFFLLLGSECYIIIEKLS